MQDGLITLNAVTKVFKPDITALNEISAAIKPGRITGLVGPDGAGKTTLLRLIAGLLKPTDGHITVGGFDTIKDAQAIHSFIGYMPQKFGLYEELTVLENLELHARLRDINGQERKNIFEKMLAFTDLERFTKRLAGKLSGGMKQKLGLACSLLGKPRFLLLDEPSVGVDPLSRRELWKMVQNLSTDGMSVLWATAYLDEAEQCEEVLLLNHGDLLYEGRPKDLTSRVDGRVYLASVPAVKRRQILSCILQKKEVVDGVIQGHNVRILFEKGKKPELRFPLEPTKARFEDAFIDILKGAYARESLLAKHMKEKPVQTVPPIQAMGLTKKFGDFTAAKDITFTIQRGEIFGLLGPNGAGKSTTFKMMCGLLQPTTGKSLISEFDLKSASSMARMRIGYMAQKFSLYGDLSVKQNLEFFSGVYGLNGTIKSDRIQELIKIFDLETYLNTDAGILPLGFKQRLALACSVIHEPDVLFLDEPTSGVDPLTRREFWTHINGMAEKGMTIMVTTHFMDEAEYCDRIALIYKGENIASNTPDGLKEVIKSKDYPDPTLEETFIELIRRADKGEG
ncbi:MAG: ATP-binding cassette domain-containing protein [Alphaproteobacteria bacterium]|nr:ATP-binding cassette domain-containing protein [Alphaproteobacteria bacterium]